MQEQSLDIGKALTYMFEEEGWGTKFLIGIVMVLLSFLIIPAFILYGYMIEIIRRVSRNQVLSLPEWDDWGTYLREGFVSMVTALVYSFPLFFLTCCATLFLSATTSDATGESGAIPVLIFCLMLLVGFLVQIPLYLLWALGLVRYAETDNAASFFQFGQLWATARANLGRYGLALLMMFVVGLVGGFVPILGSVWSTFASGHILGQLGRLIQGGLAPVDEGGLPPANDWDGVNLDLS